MTKHAFTLTTITADEATAIRQAPAAVYVADSVPGYPCRQCLRDADIGEELLLVSYDPFTQDSPYRSASPIFIHRYECTPTLDEATLPDQLTVRRLSVRSFDADQMMIDADVIEGTELEATIENFFDSPAAAKLHIHFANRGCWAVAVDRAPSAVG